MASDDLVLGQKIPNIGEDAAVGAAITKIVRDTPEFRALVRNNNPAIIFKDEEHTGADRMMTQKLGLKLDALARAVSLEWAGKQLRVTEAWDEGNEHTARSTHYEGRAADVTVSDVDSGKLGRLARLAVNAGFGWVFYEDAAHIHVSMAR